MYSFQNKIIKIVFIALLINAGCNNSSHFKTNYYKNGVPEFKYTRINDQGDVKITYYDSLGRILSESIYSETENRFVSRFKHYFGVKGARGEEGGYYFNGKSIKEYERYYDSITGKIIMENKFIIADSMLWDNCKKTYDQNGSVIRDESCYVDVKAENDTIRLGQYYVLKFDCPCLDLDLANLYTGEFDSLYNPIDNLTKYPLKDSSYIYKIKPDKLGENIVRGFVRRYKHKKIQGDQYEITGKNLYFTKKYYVLQ